VTTDEVDALAARAERACPGLYYVPAADFESLLAEVRRVNRLLAVKSDDIVERVERIAAHRCGECAGLREQLRAARAMSLSLADRLAACSAALTRAAERKEVRQYPDWLTAPAPPGVTFAPGGAR
jgi:predicted metal-binding protein